MDVAATQRPRIGPDSLWGGGGRIKEGKRLSGNQVNNSEGTASSQELTYFLKKGSSKERLENEKLREEVTHLKAKTAALEAQVSNEALLEKALKAFRSYRGEYEDEGEEDEYEDVY